MVLSSFTASSFTAVTPALAQESAPAVPDRTMPSEEGGNPAKLCAAPATPTGVLAPWTSPIPLNAAATAHEAASATLTPGQAAQVTLLPTPRVTYPLRPEKPGGTVSHGGLLALTVTETGTYRVALSSPAWIDLVAEGKPVTSVAHGHGPECTGIHKMVDFALQPGHYILQISANGPDGIEVLTARLAS